MENLFAALASAQKEFKTPPKDNDVSFGNTSYKFANLATIIETNREVMSKNGLAIVQRIGFENEIFGLITELVHKSGEKVSSFHPLPDPGKMKPQEFGARLTYARRYSWQTIQGVEGDVDNDANGVGNAANLVENGVLSKKTSNPTRSGGQTPKPQNHAPGMSDRVTVGELKVLWKVFEQKGFTKEQAAQVIQNEFNKKNVDLTKDEFHKVCDLVNSLGLALLEQTEGDK